MRDKPAFKRKNIFIKKEFQTDFSIKFLILIVIEALMAIGLFVYYTRGTVITGYSGSELVIEKTGDYFLPLIVIANLAIIGLTAAAGFVVMLYMSHRIAGPLYRFEKSLEEVGKGDLTHRLNLRSKDQISVLADRMNEFNSRMENEISQIQKGMGELGAVLAQLKSAALGNDRTGMERLAGEAQDRLTRLESSLKFFKTSHNP